MRTALFAAACVALPALLAAQDIPASRKPPCEIASDDYALVLTQPVQVGGGPMYGLARQKRYLDTLRGPEGQPVTYKRTGTQRAADETIVDVYEVRYEGLEKPIVLFIDWYHFNPYKAPRGLTCAVPFNLQPPPLDPMREGRQAQRLALEQGVTRQFAPIPLSPDGSTTHGVMYDEFRILANAAQHAAANGMRLDPDQVPREIATAGVVIVAYPRTCEGKTLAPRSVAVMDARGAAAPEQVLRRLPADGLAKVLPGVGIPDGAIAYNLGMQRPRAGDSIEIAYADACGADGDRVTFRNTFTAAKGLEMPDGVLPEGTAAAPPMLLQVIVDTDGKAQVPEYIGGPAPLMEAAKEALSRWRIEPARANGSPVATGVLLQVRFSPKK
jgi:hypothetical protein